MRDIEAPPRRSNRARLASRRRSGKHGAWKSGR
jgi:hypothetical protein